MVNGAGLAMATMDIIKMAGAAPATRAIRRLATASASRAIVPVIRSLHLEHQQRVTRHLLGEAVTR